MSPEEWCGPVVTEQEMPVSLFLERPPFSLTGNARDGAIAVAAVGAALAGGVLADRRGFRALVLPAVVVYGLGALALGATQSVVVLAAVPLLAFAAALVATLSFAWVSRLTADEDHGLTAGLFGLSQGAGIVLGPVLAGLAVELAAPALPGTDGYAAIFVVAGVAVLASLALVARVPDAPA